MDNLEKRKQAFIPEIMETDRDKFRAGDYVTRDGDDIHFVEEYDCDLIKVVCIVPPNSDYIAPGEIENNLTRRYFKINKHFLKFAQSEHEILKKRYPDGWPEDKPYMTTRAKIVVANADKIKSPTCQSLDGPGKGDHTTL